MFLLTAILAVFALALLAPTIHRALGRFGNAASLLFAIVPSALVAWLVAHIPGVAGGKVFSWAIPWAPSLGLALDLRLDGLSLLFLLLISGIGVLVLIYAGGYLAGHPQLGRFLAFLLFFMGAMLGLVSSDNLIALFVFWELTSISSYLLIGFNSEDPKSRASALRALLVTGGGGLALLAGIILLGQIGGTYSISALAAAGDQIRQSPMYLPILLLVLSGAFTKSAQVPFHFWLPTAMAAPTPVSAYLHSATMVKAGIFLMARMNPILGGSTLEWHYLLMVFGVVTMFVGALLALPQTDLKRLLAYSTVSALGTLTLLIGIGTTESLKAAAVFLLVHSLYKGALFMVAGAVDHETGTRNVRALSGLIRVMPITAVAAGLAALSMSGFPPLLGFIGKELLYEAKLAAPSAAEMITFAGVGANTIMVAVAIIVGIRPFTGATKPLASDSHAHEAPWTLWLGPMVLAASGLVFGLFPELVGAGLIEPAVAAMRGEQTAIKLKLWHGVNVVFLMSVATVLGGVVLYLLRERIRKLAAAISGLAMFGPTNLYELGLRGLLRFAALQTAFIQHGKLRLYILTVLVASLGGVGYALTRFGGVPMFESWQGLTFIEVAVALTMLVATVVVVTTKSRLTALVALGVVGYGVAMLFVFYGAPDLAITQILVETLSLLLFVLVVYKLPRFTPHSTMRRRLGDATLALAAGAVMTLLVLKAVHVTAGPRISEYLAANAINAYGRNIVNVILVDFRALDTFGEIVVLAAAALGVVALFKFDRPSGKGGRGE